MMMVHKILSECSSRWKVVCDENAKGVERFFALCEIVCFSLSWLSVGFLVVQLVFASCGRKDVFPNWLSGYLSPLLLSGAVGYLTNWLAIEMLFRPYEPKRWLPLWRQGLIPRNKPNIAKKVGDKVGNELLSPEKIASELSGHLMEWMQRPDVIAALKGRLQEFLVSHQEAVIQFLVPQIENTLKEYVDKLVNPQSIQALWKTQLLPLLNNQENRQRIAGGLVSFCKGNAGSFAGIARGRIHQHLQEKLSGILLVGNYAERIADWIVEFFADEESMKEMLSSWLAEPETQEMLEQNVAKICEQFNEWMNSPQATGKLGEYASNASEKLKLKVVEYLHDAFPKTVKSALASDKLWDWFERTALPMLSSMLSDYITEHRQDFIDQLRLSERVEEAINRQDIGQFHQMVNEIAAEHLGAIQVLGFILGGVVGAFQVVQGMLLR